MENENLKDFVTWEDFLSLANKVYKQEQLIKICFQNGEILNDKLKKKKKQKHN